MLILWQFEECENSAPVREKLTAMALDFIAINAPQGHPEKDAVMIKLFGSAKTPSLWDTHTGILLQGTDRCLNYLKDQYDLDSAA